jgi:hypothetical protein
MQEIFQRETRTLISIKQDTRTKVPNGYIPTFASDEIVARLLGIPKYSIEELKNFQSSGELERIFKDIPESNYKR